MQVFCFPYAGASAMFYNRWRRTAAAWLLISPVELPGRGARLSEALPTDLQELAETLAQELRAQLRPPYVLFGHSLGALLAFEIAHALRKLGCPLPQTLCVSGSAAPSHRDDRVREYGKPKTDAELVANLQELQGTPPEVLANAELMEMTLPILRTDFLLCGRYRYVERPPLACRIHVLGGSDDVSIDQLKPWQAEATGEFFLDMFEGGHFFIHDRQPEVLRAIERRLDGSSSLFESIRS